MHQSQLSILITDEGVTCSTIKTVYCRSCFCKNGWINWRNIFRWDCLSRYGTIIATRCRGRQSVGVQKPPESTGEQLNVWSNVFLDPRFAWTSLDASVKPAKNATNWGLMQCNALVLVWLSTTINSFVSLMSIEFNKNNQNYNNIRDITEIRSGRPDFTKIGQFVFANSSSKANNALKRKVSKWLPATSWTLTASLRKTCKFLIVSFQKTNQWPSMLA